MKFIRNHRFEVFKNNKWNIKDKHDIIEDIVDKGYNIIDGHFDGEKNIELDEKKKKNFEDFQKLFDNNDKRLHKVLEKNTEILIINNS